MNSKLLVNISGEKIRRGYNIKVYLKRQEHTTQKCGMSVVSRTALRHSCKKSGLERIRNEIIRDMIKADIRVMLVTQQRQFAGLNTQKELKGT